VALEDNPTEIPAMALANHPKNKSVTKRELVLEIVERLGYAQNEVAEAVQATLDTIIEALAEGRRLEIRNFGVFEVHTRNPRLGRNPRTGEEVKIAQKRVASFKPGKALKDNVRAQLSLAPTSEAKSTDVPQPSDSVPEQSSEPSPA